MTTSAPPTSASDGAERREDAAALAAGWRPVELRWERRQEAAMEAYRAGNLDAAIRHWKAARRTAFWRFHRSDPRYATSLANAAMAARLAGRERHAHRLYARAMALWSRVPAKIAGIEPSRRARSSLFHLRMEALHWDTFRDNHRRRLTAFAAEAQEALKALANGCTPEVRLYERWRGEKPPFFDDTRKFLSAVLLIAADRPHQS